jgi:hypothetical protein
LRFAHRLPSVADALADGAETRLRKQWRVITPTRNIEPGIAADDEFFATSSTTEQTVHHRGFGQ